LSEQVFLLPDVGEGLVEAEIVAWKVGVGDSVTLNQPLVDIETAKAVVELPSPYAGVIVTLHGNVGDVMEVHQPLVTFETGGSSTQAPPSDVSAAPPPSETSPVSTPSVEKREAVLVGYGVSNEEGVAARKHRRQSASSSPARSPVATTTGAVASPRSTPPVRLYAKQHGLDLAAIAGTGRDGLITRHDVEQALSGPSVATSVRAVALATGPTSTSRFVGRDIESWDSGPKEERIPVKGVLRSMAEAMTQSAFSAPHAAVWMRVDVTKTMELLTSLKSRSSMSAVKLSPLTLVAMAFCDAARHYPGINSSFDAAAGEVIVRRSVNLGIAADTPRGLIVPNIKSADQLDLVAMAQAQSTLVEKARAGTTTPNEMTGTTLTITNVGPFGVDAAIPILPPGTGAILAVGRFAKAPWVVDDLVVVRYVTELAMAFDHRQVDGALASRVIAHVAHFLEDPAPALLVG